MEIKKSYDLITITDPLIEPFYIVKDRWCFTLYENVKSQESTKEYGKAIGHYTSIGMIFRKLAESKLHSKAKYKSIKEFLDYYKNINIELDKLLKQVVL